MIVDNLNKMSNYESIVPGLTKAINHIRSLDEYVVGKYYLEHGFYMIQEGYTVRLEDNLFEAHEKYIDIQIMMEGMEIVEWAKIDELTLLKPYDEIKDIKFYSGEGTPITIHSGMAYILFPSDGHKPCCHRQEESSKYKKVVIKLPFLK